VITGVSAFADESRIMNFSCPRHNEFATSAGARQRRDVTCDRHLPSNITATIPCFRSYVLLGTSGNGYFALISCALLILIGTRSFGVSCLRVRILRFAWVTYMINFRGPEFNTPCSASITDG
jgi:hypothetical protein